LVYFVGETIVIQVSVKDPKNDTLVDPDSITMDVYDPSDNKVVSGDVLTQTGTGIYEYKYTFENAAGLWRFRVKAVAGTFTAIEELQIQVEW